MSQPFLFQSPIQGVGSVHAPYAQNQKASTLFFDQRLAPFQRIRVMPFHSRSSWNCCPEAGRLGNPYQAYQQARCTGAVGAIRGDDSFL